MKKKKESRFSVGDWIVHYFHGIGQVEAIVQKGLAGKRKTYYRVATEEMKYWLPIDEEDSEHIEPIRTKMEFEEAIKEFSTPPQPIAKHFKARKNLIHKRWLDGDLLSRARLIRDLAGRNHLKRLSFNEKEILETLEKYFVDEWLVADPDLTRSVAYEKMNTLLSLSLNSITEQ
jgi:RNA polymerase-interacting CarD/CdnL/TRCF family regulator